MFLDTKRKEDNAAMMFSMPGTPSAVRVDMAAPGDWDFAVSANLEESFAALRREMLIPSKFLQPPETDWRRVLEKAAIIIENRGHTKEQFEDPRTGAVCAYQAICLGAGFSAQAVDISNHYNAREALRHVAAHVTGKPISQVTTSMICAWNNQVSTDWQQVAAVMRTVARAA